MRYSKHLQAFTLVEVLIAILILSISLISLYKLNIISLGTGSRADNLEKGMMAADYLMKGILKDGFPVTGMNEGSFKKGAFKGLKWKSSVESFDLPFLEDLRKVTVEVFWTGGNKYKLTAIVSKYR